MRNFTTASPSGRLAAFVIVTCGLLAGTAKADIIYQVSVNTSSISGTPGNIDLQFNPGGGSTQPASVRISSFSSVGGVITGAPSTVGDVSGTLPGTVTINNTTALNDYFQPFTYGNSFSFRLLFTGPAINAPNGTATSGSEFGLSLFNSDGSNVFLTTNPDGFAATANVNLNGTVTTTTYPSNGNGGAPVVTFTTVVATPEPATFAMSFAAATVLGAALHRNRKR